MRVCVCVCVCVRVASVDQLVRELHLENGNIRDIEVIGLRTSTDIISLHKKFTHNCLSRLRSINVYLVFDWGWTRPLALQNNMQYIRVRVHLRSSLAAASRSVPFFVLATYQGIRQCGLKLRVAPESLPRIGRGCYL